MILILFGAVFLGIASGMFLEHSMIIDNLDNITIYLLGFLLFSVGLDIGRSKSTFTDLSSKLQKILVVSMGTILGSLFGGFLMMFIFSMKINEALAVSAGFGWYSLSGIILSSLGNAELGSIAFISNIFREILAILMIPLISAKLGFLSAIGPSGATSMDTTLPVISRYTDEETAIIAFINGAILSALVPIIVPILYNIKI